METHHILTQKSVCPCLDIVTTQRLTEMTPTTFTTLPFRNQQLFQLVEVEAIVVVIVLVVVMAEEVGRGSNLSGYRNRDRCI